MYSIKEYIVLLFFVVISVLLFPHDIYAQRLAECDACGYCQGEEAPATWEQCRACIYPNASKNALDNSTLLIDPVLNKAQLQPASGKYFTQLGCIDTNLTSFQDAGAAGGVLNFILTRLLFPITGVLAFMSLVYGAFLLATAQSDQLQIQRGRRFVFGAIIGTIFTFSVVLLVNTIGANILRIPGFSKRIPIVISTASNCLDTKGNTETICPILKVQISQNRTVVEEGDVGQIPTFKAGYPDRPNLDDYADFTYYSSQDITKDTIGSTYHISVVYDNDETNGQGNTPNFRDKNLYIQNITVDGKRCTSMQQGTWSAPGALVFITNNGIYRCLSWH